MHQTAPSAGSARRIEARLLIDPPASGVWNMSVDEVLLREAAERGTGSLRFYAWSEPTLSLGYFQASADRRQHAASREAAMVRRQTGGGAIVHDRELTYSIALPPDHGVARQSLALYATVHDVFIGAIGELLPGLAAEWSLARYENPASKGEEPFLCFARRARGDVVATPGQVGGQAVRDWKILGSAQRRYRGALLQHGSLLIGRSLAAPELAGIEDLTSDRLAIDALRSRVAEQLGEQLALGTRASDLPDALRSRADDLAQQKYGHPAWTNRR